MNQRANTFSRGTISEVASEMDISIQNAWNRIYRDKNLDALELAVKFEEARQARKQKVQKRLQKLNDNPN